MPDYYSSDRSSRSAGSRSSSSRPAGTRSSSTIRSSYDRGYSDAPHRASGSRSSGTRSYASRPAGSHPSGSRPSGNRPSSNPPRRNGSSSRRRRRRKSVQPRFFLILAIIVVIIVALIIFLTSKGGNKAVTPATTESNSNVVISAEDTQSNTTAESGSTGSDTAAASFDDLNGTIEEDEEDDNLAQLSDEDRIQVSAADLSVNTSLPDTWINILLLGSDERVPNENARTDTMIICSINKDTGAVKLTSIMRDSAIKITGTKNYNGTYRINSANYFGGPNYAMKVVNECLGLNIQYYADVNFFGFQRIATALGGIDVDISEAEMNEINKKQIEQAKIAYVNGWDEGDIENELLTTYGKNTHLNGRQTVAYARVRKIDSDFSRSERQRTVLVKLMEKLKGKSMAELAVLGTSLIDYVTTNMDFNTVLDIATKVLSSGLSLNSDNMFRVPINGSYTEEVRNEEAMFYDIDWDTNAKELYNFIYVK